MRNNLLILPILALGTSASYAQFYVGGDVGLNAAQSNVTFTRDPDSVKVPSSDYYTLKPSNNSFIAGLFGGWTFKSGIFAAGFEVGGTANTMSDKIFTFNNQDGINEKFTMKSPGSLESSVRFGIYVNPQSYLYMKPSIIFTRIKTTFSGVDSVSTPGHLYQDRRSSSSSTGAFKLALGYEGFVSSRFSIRSEVSHTFGTNHRLHIPNYVGPDYGAEETTIKFRTSHTAFKVGFAYHFC